MSGSEGHQVRIHDYRPGLIANSIEIGVAIVRPCNPLLSCESLVHNEEIEMGGEPRECC